MGYLNAEVRYEGATAPVAAYDSPPEDSPVLLKDMVTLVVDGVELLVSAQTLVDGLAAIGAIPNIHETERDLLELSSMWAGACAKLMNEKKAQKGAN